MDMDKLNQVIDGLGRGFEEMKSRIDTQEAELKKFGAVDVVSKDVTDKIAKELADLKSQKDEIERKLNAASLSTGNVKDDEAREQRAEFVQAMRKKAAYERLEAKAVDADFSSNSTSGGVAIPEVINREILAKLKDISPMRNLVRVTQVGSPNYERLVNVKGTASGWAAEDTTRAETDTPTIQRVTFTHGELYAVPKASNWALNDLMIDVGAMLVEEVAEEFAYQEGLAIISGNGTNKPTGFLNGSPSSATDEESPARAFGTIQYLPTGTAGGFGSLSVTSPENYPSDVLFNTIYALKAGYRANARWVMNKNLLATVMTFKDADGNLLWRPGLAMGQPDMLLGYGVTEAEGMPDVGSNTFPIAFGDFRAGYELIDISGMRMIRDDVTVKGYTLFYISRRLGGKVVNDDAIKVIKCAAS